LGFGLGLELGLTVASGLDLQSQESCDTEHAKGQGQRSVS